MSKKSLSFLLCLSLTTSTFSPCICATEAPEPNTHKYEDDDDNFETIHVKKELAPVIDYGKSALYIVLSIALKKCIDRLGNPVTFSSKLLFGGLHVSMAITILNSILSTSKPLVSAMKAFGNAFF